MRRLRNPLSTLLSATLIASLLALVGITPAQATTPTCASGVLTPLHRPNIAPDTPGPFYIDWGKGLKSNWIGYRLDPTAAAGQSLTTTAPYIKLNLVKGSGNLQIANKGYDTIAVDAPAREGTVGSKLAYFYLTAGSVFTTTTNFTATLYSGDPAVDGVAQCTFTDGFRNAEDVIAANPNSISSITTATVDGNIVVTAAGATGTMGNPSKDYIGINGTYYVTSGGAATIGNAQKSAFQTAIAMDPTWNASMYVLQGMEIFKTGSGTSYYDSVRFYLTKAQIEGNYTVKYTLKPVAQSGSAAIKPRQVIASGNEYKYTGSLPTTTVSLTAAGAKRVNIVKSLKSVASTSLTNCGTSTGNCYKASYEVEVTNPDNDPVTNIQVTDTPTARGGVTWTFANDAKRDTVTLEAPNLPTVTGTKITFAKFDLAGAGEGDMTKFEYSLYITGSVTNTVTATIDGVTDTFESNAVTALMDITTESVPATTDGNTTYSTVIEQSGGSECTWTISGADRPDWLVINASTGEVYVDPAAVTGTYTFTVTATCAGELSASRNYTLNVLGVTTASLPSVCAGDSYSATLSAAGGTSGYSWSISSGSLPSGISLSTSGIVSGSASATGNYTFSVRVTSGDLSRSRSLSILVQGCASSQNQVITFPQVPTRTWGSNNPSSLPTATSGLSVTVTNNTPDICAYSAGVITILRVGTCSLTATQPGGGSWNPAAPVTMTFLIVPAPATVTAANQSKVEGTADPVCSTSVTGLVRGDTVTGITCSRTPGETPGSYVITPRGGNFTTNYVVTYINGNLTITAAPPIAPATPGAGIYTPRAMNLTTISWGPSATAGVTYEVYYNGSLVCSTVSTSCDAARIIGPKSNVSVLALKNGLKSDRVRLSYNFDKPIVALTVYFDVDRSNITVSERKVVVRVTSILKREGFLKYAIVGHTDSDASAGYNKALSDRRSVALQKLVRTLLGGGTFELRGSGFDDPAAANTTPKGKSLNRRSVLYING